MPVIIYRLTFSNGDTYIGQTSLTLEKRLSLHRSRIKRDKYPVAVAWRTCGEPIADVLAIVDKSIARESERNAIAALNSTCNILGIRGRRGPHSAKHKAN